MKILLIMILAVPLWAVPMQWVSKASVDAANLTTPGTINHYSSRALCEAKEGANCYRAVDEDGNLFDLEVSRIVNGQIVEHADLVSDKQARKDAKDLKKANKNQAKGRLKGLNMNSVNTLDQLKDVVADLIEASE